MQFYEFATRLKPYLGNGKRDADYVLMLFDNITDYDSEDPKNPLTDGFNENTLRGYLNPGGNDISRLASKISSHVDAMHFQDFLDKETNDAVQIRLISDFKDVFPTVDPRDITGKIADLFEDIIITAAKCKKKKKAKNKGFNPQSNSFEDTDVYYIDEVGGKCPMLGQLLQKSTPTGIVRNYEIIHIFPETLNLLGQQEFSEVNPPANLESPDNKLAVCKEYAELYRQDPTLERYKILLEKKEKYKKRRALYEKTVKIEIESGIKAILKNVNNLKERPSGATETKWEAFTVDKKIKDNYGLEREITQNVLEYYHYLEEQFKDMQGIDGFDFDKLKCQIHLCYKECESSGYSQEQTYEFLSDWVSKETGCDSSLACRIFVSFFVQICEVFYVAAE